jgi:WD40 repeat protein
VIVLGVVFIRPLTGGQHTTNPAANSRQARPEADVAPKAQTDRHGDPLPAGALARLGTVRFRHAGQVLFLAFAPDGRTLASGHADGALRLWEAATGKPLQRFQAQLLGKYSAVFAPDGKTLAFMGSNHHLQIRDVASGKEVRSVPVPPTGFQAMAFSPDGKMAALFTPDQMIHFWDLAAGREVRKLASPFIGLQAGATLSIGHMAFSPDSKVLACGTSNGANVSIRFLSVAGGKDPEALAGPAGQLTALVYSPDGKKLAVAGNGQRVHVYEIATSRDVNQVASLGVQWFSVAFAPSGKHLAVANNTQVDLVDLSTDKVLRQFPGNLGGGSPCVAFSHDGKTLAIGTGDAAVRLYDAETGKEVAAKKAHRGTVTAVVYSPDGRYLASTSSDHTIRLWDVDGAREVKQFTRPKAAEPGFPALGNPTSIVFSSDGRVLAAAWADGLVSRWDVATGKELRRTLESDKGYQASVFSPDGALLARTAPDGAVNIWEVATGRKLRQLGGQPGQPGQVLVQPFALAFAPDGRTLATGRGQGGFNPYLSSTAFGGMMGGQGAFNGGVQLWEISTGKERGQIAPSSAGSPWLGGYGISGPVGIQPGWMMPMGNAVSKLAFSPDGRTLAITGDAVRLWDLAHRRQRLRLDAPPFSTINALAYSPDSKMLALGGVGEFTLWDGASGEELGRRAGLQGAIAALAFSPDCKTVVSGSTDSTMLLWNVKDLVDESRRRKADPSNRQLEEFWKDLGSGDAAQAYRAVWGLAKVPHKALPLLRQRLRPVPQLDSKLVARLVADLEHERYVVRQRAARELERLGDLAEPALRRALDGDPSLELRRRAEQLLEKTGGPVTDPDQLRTLRAVEALEHAGTAEARQLLEELARGSAEARQTREARLALQRLARQQSGTP